MNDAATRALLPEGLHDTLAPRAELESRAVVALLACFSAHGYDQVAPPLVEFEDSLLAGVGAAEGRRMFRLMDPASHRMMGVRTDMTTQVARVATTRLAAAPRPLRLCYAGQVLRVESGKLRSEREFGQAGIELIGTASTGAEAEVLLLAAEALHSVGAVDFTIDLTVPTLVPAVSAGLGLDAARAAIARDALDEKDMAGLSVFDGRVREVFETLLLAGGEADKALDALTGLDLPGEAAALVEELRAMVGTLRGAAPALTLTIDPGEYRNFEYHTGICFTAFDRNGSRELGRGGRYQVQGAASLEPAVGFTVYVDSLLRALPEPRRANAVFVPAGTPREAAEGLRSSGWRTVAGLDAVADDAREARRLGCSHVYRNGSVEGV
ncbi:ATP phosphoribosyltransferase regulatory subunit [Emcibacter sp. SYSU 3D8]|uniref:ATP phosphoribosyltransferase regulatory subunit n=1 Tax=Emcibacter sp. SYSU 3D8 TaxID=3133969 RepID=UPI0031FE791D